MLNYEIEPRLLEPYLPERLRVGFVEWNVLRKCCRFPFFGNKSACGCESRSTRILKRNLRFYVHRRVAEEWRGGVLFLSVKLSRKQAIAATIARIFYNEPYMALQMRHQVMMQRMENFNREAVK